MLQKACEVLEEKGKPRNIEDPDNLEKTEAAQKKMAEWWNNIQKRRFRDAELAHDFGNREYAQLVCLEIDGGKCPRCSRNWRRIEFSNFFGKGFYFRPNCDCFFRCPNCDSELFDEMMRGILKATNHHCPKCKWPLIHDGKKNWGKEVEAIFHEKRNKPWEILQWKKDLGIIREAKSK